MAHREVRQGPPYVDHGGERNESVNIKAGECSVLRRQFGQAPALKEVLQDPVDYTLRSRLILANWGDQKPGER